MKRYKKTGSEPERTCIACRSSLDKKSLLRFVLSPEKDVVPDIEGRLPGRGAYTCLSAACVRNAVRTRAFSRSFKGEARTPAADEMVTVLSCQMLGRIRGYVSLANKAGKIVLGGALVTDAISSGRKPLLVMIAEDVSGPIGDKLAAMSGYAGIHWFKVLTKDDYGDLSGKSPRSAIAVKDSGFALSLTKEIERYRKFLKEVGEI